MNVIGDGAYWRKLRHLMDVTYRQEFLDSAYFEVMAFKNHETRREKNYADIASRLQLNPFAPPIGKFNPALTEEGDLVLDRKVTVDNTHGFKFKTGVTAGSHELMG